MNAKNASTIITVTVMAALSLVAHEMNNPDTCPTKATDKIDWTGFCEANGYGGCEISTYPASWVCEFSTTDTSCNREMLHEHVYDQIVMNTSTVQYTYKSGSCTEDGYLGSDENGDLVWIIERFYCLWKPATNKEVTFDHFCATIACPTSGG